MGSIQEVHFGKTVKFITAAAVGKTVLDFYHKNALAGNFIKRQIDYSSAVFIGTERNIFPEDDLTEKVFNFKFGNTFG